MCIFKSRWKEKGLCAVVASAGLCTGFAWANGLPPASLSLNNNGTPVNSRGGVFKSNVSVNAVKLGDKTFDLKGADFHAPVAVKLFAQSDADTERFEPVPDARIGTPGGAFRFALSEDVENVPGMTSLDVAQSSDFGRMLAPTGVRATRMQMFLPMPERENDSLNNAKAPELLLMGAVPNGTIKVTPILAGTPDIPESLIFGRTLELDPSAIASGRTSVSMVPHGDTAPQRMCVIGLNMAADLHVEPGRMVVGYQLECPAGANAPLKMISMGKQESTVYASNAPGLSAGVLTIGNSDYATSFDIYGQTPASAPAEGAANAPAAAPGGVANEDFAPDDRVYTQFLGPLFRQGQVGVPQNFPLPDYVASNNGYSARSAFLDDVGTPGYNPPPTPPVPAPGAVALIGAAAVAMTRRRRA